MEKTYSTTSKWKLKTLEIYDAISGSIISKGFYILTASQIFRHKQKQMELTWNFGTGKMVQKVPDRYSVLLGSTIQTAAELPESIEALVEEARMKQYDMPTLLMQLKGMVCAIVASYLPPTLVSTVWCFCDS